MLKEGKYPVGDQGGDTEVMDGEMFDQIVTIMLAVFGVVLVTWAALAEIFGFTLYPLL